MDNIQNQPKTKPQEDTKTMRLRTPITLPGDTVTYDCITLREPTLEELDRAMQQSTQLSMAAVMISSAANIPLLVARKLGSRDMKEAMEFLASFTEDSPTTGALLSPT